jgi:hypothetical protein
LEASPFSSSSSSSNYPATSRYLHISIYSLTCFYYRKPSFTVAFRIIWQSINVPTTEAAPIRHMLRRILGHFGS